MASYEYRELQIIDPDLFSGSVDVFRTAHGGYYYIENFEDDEDKPMVSFASAEWTNNHTGDDPDTHSPYIDAHEVAIQFENATPINTEVLTPNRKIPMRIYGDEDAVKNDLHWKTILIGGQFGDTSYTPLYNDSVHSYFNAPYDMPYEALQALKLYDDDSAITMQITYNYDNYLPTYQEHAANAQSELLIPNIDMIYDLYMEGYEFINAEGDASLYDKNYVNFITREGDYPNCSNLLSYNPSNLAFTPFQDTAPSEIRTQYPDIFKNNTNLSVLYLTASYVQTPLSASTQQWAESRFKNIMYDTEALQQRPTNEDYEELVRKTPYSVKIQIPQYEGNLLDETEGYFLNSINNNAFDSRFIKALYETFGNSTAASPLEPEDKEYIRYFRHLTGATDSTTGELTHDALSTTVANTTYREIDYMKLLTYCYNNYISPSDENFFIGHRNMQRASADDDTGIYRHANTEAAIKSISDAVEFMSGTYMPFEQMSDFFGDNDSYTEVVAYRVEKIGGPPTGDSNTQDALQNFWLLRSSEVEDFIFNDSQIKYNQEYTYKVYAYAIVGGYRYRYSDLVVSRDLGCESSVGRYGLEMYDPYSAGEPRTSYIFSSSLPTVSDYNEDAAEPQILSAYRYVADVYLNYEPSLKIIEIPLITKTLKVQDNPANAMDIVPYQLIDNSQRIGFQVTFGSYLAQNFPTPVTSNDDDYMESYLRSRDYIDSSDILFESISRPRYVEIFRLPYRPSSLRDFDGALLRTLDLVYEEDSKYSYKSMHFDDTINTNQKYYYMMRTLNQQRNVGHLSEIYEAQLINDGGYLYAIFNVLYHYEIEQEVFINPTKSFKKIFQLQPNMNQIQLITTDVDYSQEATAQIGNVQVGDVEELIWDKTFKIRLTSKKTGRKIDLNITYNLNSD